MLFNYCLACGIFCNSFLLIFTEPNNFGGGFIAIQDQVKLEPRDQQSSPYFNNGNYRIPQTTPSPTPSHTALSPPSPLNFIAQASTSPSPYHPGNNNGHVTTNGNNASNQIESILQNHLQAPRNNGFQPTTHQNNVFTPNIINNPSVVSYTIENSTIWSSNNLNGMCAPSTSRTTSQMPMYNHNNLPAMTSSIFNQPMNPAQNFNITSNNIINMNNNNDFEHKSNYSSLLDLDSQQLLSEQVLNLSGEMQNLSFGDCIMNSYKHDK